MQEFSAPFAEHEAEARTLISKERRARAEANARAEKKAGERRGADTGAEWEKAMAAAAPVPHTLFPQTAVAL